MHLEGIRILDFSQYIPGPYASQRLADYGAEVIKVEPIGGELGRAPMGALEEQGLVCEVNNTNKKSITLNLKREAGLQIAKELIAVSDVLIEGFRPGVMKKLGLDYETVRLINPTIVYCSITGYGQYGESSRLGSHDINYMSVSGVLSQFKDGSGRPVHPTITLADNLGGMAATENILASLFRRERTGKGDYIDVSLTDALVALMNNHVITEHKTGRLHGVSALAGNLVCYTIYETKDQRYVSLAALERKFWESFIEACGLGHLIDDHLTEASCDNPTFVELKEVFKSRTMKEWEEFSRQVDCCLTPILETVEVKERFASQPRRLIDVEKSIQVATRYDERILPSRHPSPAAGEHSEEILMDLLGYSKDTLVLYKENQII
ncbi:CoA transferase [Bacillus timonensis]|nr:CoA transferase [Bacillus timonensis]